MQRLPQDKVSIEWVLSHVNIFGNEQADQLASESIKGNIISSIPPSQVQMKAAIRKFSRDIWTTQVKGMDQSNIRFKTNIGPMAYSDIHRSKQVVMTRIRLKVTKLTHAHYFTNSPPRICNACNVILSLEHLFIYCPLHMNQRQRLTAQCQKENLSFDLDDITSPPFPADLIIKFLEETNHLKEIYALGRRGTKIQEGDEPYLLK